MKKLIILLLLVASSMIINGQCRIGFEKMEIKKELELRKISYVENDSIVVLRDNIKITYIFDGNYCSQTAITTSDNKGYLKYSRKFDAAFVKVKFGVWTLLGTDLVVELVNANRFLMRLKLPP